MATQGGMCKSIHFVYRCRIWIGVPSPHSFASYQDPELLNKQKTNKNNATQVVHMVEWFLFCRVIYWDLFRSWSLRCLPGWCQGLSAISRWRGFLVSVLFMSLKAKGLEQLFTWTQPHPKHQKACSSGMTVMLPGMTNESSNVWLEVSISHSLEKTHAVEEMNDVQPFVCSKSCLCSV